MLESNALDDLRKRLRAALNSMRINDLAYGMPSLVEHAALDAEHLFQGYAKAKPSFEDSYATALKFLRGEHLNEVQRDLVAPVICMSVKEQGAKTVVGSSRFTSLLNSYLNDAESGNLWRLTWYSLLSSYFTFDIEKATQEERLGWQLLRQMLEKTWTSVDKEAGLNIVPDWVTLLRRESNILGPEPTQKYADEFLNGNEAVVRSLADDLGIPSSSWFWHSLVLSVVRSACSLDDTKFNGRISTLIQLLEQRTVFRDEAIVNLLTRFHNSKSLKQNEQLRDYVVRQDIWKNPKLKSAGIATAWNQVTTPVWQMVLSWVNERNLKDFFDILAARNHADEGRLVFWSRFLKQINWTRLVFGSQTMLLKNSNREIRELIAREEGAYAELTGNRSVDAFMIGIGEYIIIEFSKAPNAAYIYHSNTMKFDRHAKYFSGKTDDLKYGHHRSDIVSIIHNRNWQSNALRDLANIGIYPDDRISSVPLRALSSSISGTNVQSSVNKTSPQSSSIPFESKIISDRDINNRFDMSKLEKLFVQFEGFTIRDGRHRNRGRLWVNDPLNRVQLAQELRALGMSWSNANQSWYLEEN